MEIGQGRTSENEEKSSEDDEGAKENNPVGGSDDFEQLCEMSGIPLTHYQTTNFRLFQTERVCR